MTAFQCCSAAAHRPNARPCCRRSNAATGYCGIHPYTGASPNQNSFPLAEYIVRNHGRRVFLVGSDYIYPRESNRIMRDLVESYAGQVAGEQYVAMDADEAELTRALELIRMRSPDVVFSTIVGRSAQRFYRLFHETGFDPAR